MATVSGSTTQPTTSVSSRAELSGVPTGAFRPGELGAVSQGGSSPVIYFELLPGSTAIVDGVNVLYTANSNPANGGSGPGRWVLFSGGSGGGNMFPNRYDLSVNHARAESAQGAVASLITLSSGNNQALGYNGGGLGNKAILGFKGHAGLGLGSLLSLSWEYEYVSLEVPPRLPYGNLIVDVGGGAFKVFVLDPAVVGTLNTGTITPLGGNRFRFTYLAASNFIQVVNAFTTPPVLSPPVPIAAGAGPFWQSASFRASDILASFPASMLVDASSGDGGLPRATVTPALLIIEGDSVELLHRVVNITNVLINGIAA